MSPKEKLNTANTASKRVVVTVKTKFLTHYKKCLKKEETQN